jgi:hypothetical protein
MQQYNKKFSKFRRENRNSKTFEIKIAALFPISLWTAEKRAERKRLTTHDPRPVIRFLTNVKRYRPWTV